MAQNCQVFGTLTGLNGLYTLSPMPIHLIIDGYNQLVVRGGLRGDVEARREQLNRDLAGYRQHKGHHVTVIFDGWRAGHPVERAEWREGLEVVYSKQGEQADAVVKRLAEKYGSALAVVFAGHRNGKFAPGPRSLGA